MGFSGFPAVTTPLSASDIFLLEQGGSTKKITVATLRDQIVTQGSWSPADESGAGLSITVNAGYYIQIGDLVFVTCDITYPATGSGADARIGPVPITSDEQPVALSAFVNSGVPAAFTPFMNAFEDILFREQTNTDNLTNAELSGATLYVSGIYRAV